MIENTQRARIDKPWRVKRPEVAGHFHIGTEWWASRTSRGPVIRLHNGQVCFAAKHTSSIQKLNASQKAGELGTDGTNMLLGGKRCPLSPLPYLTLSASLLNHTNTNRILSLQ